MKRIARIMGVSITLSACVPSWPQTELYAGIPQPQGPGSNSTDVDERPTNVMLRQRVQSRFPVGSDESALLTWLDAQKVEVRRNPREEGGVRGQAVRRLGTWPCDRSVVVRWRASASGEIEEITAVEGGSGCF